MEKKTKKAAVIDGDVNKSAKQKALETAIEQIEKTYGKGSIMKLSDTNIDHVEVISTGCISIDMALGIGGLPRGSVYRRRTCSRPRLCVASRNKYFRTVYFSAR